MFANGLIAAYAPTEDDGKQRRVPGLADSFPEQWEYITSRDLFNDLVCSRRSGKTHGAVDRHVLLHDEIPPGSWTHFGSLIRRNARKHFWNPLKKRLDDLGWGYRANNTEMILETDRGTFCQAFGCDDEAGTKAVQGDGSMLFTIDECHLPNDDVLRLLVDVATPMLTDRGGMLDKLGLPPEVDGGYFSESLDGGGSRVFSWTMFDHDFPRPREEKLADVMERCRRRGLALEIITTMGADGRPRYSCGPGTHPIAARQYFGRRVKDPTKTAYEYFSGRNDYAPAAVDFTTPTWRHAVGLDLGFQDRDACVVVAWRTDDPARKLYVRFVWQRNHLDVDQLKPVLAAVRDVYRPGTWTGDHGGHGAVKVMATLEAHLGVKINPKPGDVMVSVGLVNDDLRTGRLLFPTADAETEKVRAAILAKAGRYPEAAAAALLLDGERADLAGEAGKVLKTTNPRTRKVEINKKGFHSDLTEGLRYAHAGASHFRARAPALKDEELSNDERRRLHEERIWQRERKRFPWAK